MKKMKSNREIVIKQKLAANSDDVWSAISNPAVMERWYFNITDFKPVVGCEFDWWGGEDESSLWHHRGRVEKVLPGQYLSYTWEYPGFTGKGRCVWRLSQIDEGLTELNFSFEFITPFQEDQPALARENFELGWNTFICDLLPGFLKG